MGIVAAAVIIITINVMPMFNTLEEAFRASLFQVSSIISTTGFSSTNFDLWPQLSKSILLVLMVIGACAGSTGGGIKVSRVVIMFKNICKDLRRMSHPRYVRCIKSGGKPVDDEIVSGVMSYMVIYVFITGLSFLLISIDNLDLESTFSGLMACLNNVGPGFGEVGPLGSYSLFSPFSKIVLSIDMLFGRLEFIPLVLIMTPSFWKK